MKKSFYLLLLLSGLGLPRPLSAQPLQPRNQAKVYARFVPERDDDFAWENDRVAFRVYGPALQKKAERHLSGGLITSGVDCWFKRVDYPIIDRWYQHMDYHKDHGEGLDCYNVGPSRGCGGTAIYYQGKYIVSQNFTHYKILEQTPDKVVFQLYYAPVYIAGKPVRETKTITMESGNHYYRCDVQFETDLHLEILATGLALHQGHGEVRTSNRGWVAYWETLQGNGVGTAVWCAAPNYKGYHVEKRGNPNAWLHLALRYNRATYYAGFTWTKAGHHQHLEEWLTYLKGQQSALEK